MRRSAFAFLGIFALFIVLVSFQIASATGRPVAEKTPPALYMQAATGKPVKAVIDKGATATATLGAPTGSTASKSKKATGEKSSSVLVTEARKWIGTNPTGWSHVWCARFMNFVLKRAGYEGTGSDAASSFASYGRRIWWPQEGAIAVMTRGRNGGHVGIVTGVADDGKIIVISGNHNKRVGVGHYPRERIYAYVLPN
jgi:uncharacterized protein (TIGR02594 family)